MKKIVPVLSALVLFQIFSGAVWANSAVHQDKSKEFVIATVEPKYKLAVEDLVKMIPEDLLSKGYIFDGATGQNLKTRNDVKKALLTNTRKPYYIACDAGEKELRQDLVNAAVYVKEPNKPSQISYYISYNEANNRYILRSVMNQQCNRQNLIKN